MTLENTILASDLALKLKKPHRDFLSLIDGMLKKGELEKSDATPTTFRPKSRPKMEARTYFLSDFAANKITHFFVPRPEGEKPPTRQQFMQKTKLDTNEVQVGQNQAFDIPNTGHIDRENFRDEFATVDTPTWKDTAKLAAFMEEPVLVVISDTEAQNAEQVIQLAVQGKNQFIFRGTPIWVKRKYLEVLARARPESITTQEFTDASGNRATRILKTMGLKYPFRVLEDKNPDGSRWLETILKEQN